MNNFIVIAVLDDLMSFRSDPVTYEQADALIKALRARGYVVSMFARLVGPDLDTPKGKRS